MKIRIAGLRTGRNEIEEKIDPTELGLDPSIFKDTAFVQVIAEKNGGRVTLSVETTTEGLFLCDRCGEEYHRRVSGNYELVYIQRDEPFPDEQPGDDLRSYSPYQEYIDVSPEIRDELLISLPMKNLCSEECKGLCARCGANLNNESCHCVTKSDGNY